jgi:hypothetical protein
MLRERARSKASARAVDGRSCTCRVSLLYSYSAPRRAQARANRGRCLVENECNATELWGASNAAGAGLAEGRGTTDSLGCPVPSPSERSAPGAGAIHALLPLQPGTSGREPPPQDAGKAAQSKRDLVNCLGRPWRKDQDSDDDDDDEKRRG